MLLQSETKIEPDLRLAHAYIRTVLQSSERVSLTIFVGMPCASLCEGESFRGQITPGVSTPRILELFSLGV